MNDRPLSRPQPRAAAAPPRQRQPAQAAPAGSGYHEDQQENGPVVSRFFTFTAIPSWMTSMLLHIVLLFVLALITLSAVTEMDDIIVLADDKQEIEKPEEDIPEVEVPKVENFVKTDISHLPIPEAPAAEPFSALDDYDDPPPTMAIIDPQGLLTNIPGDCNMAGIPGGDGFKRRIDIFGPGPPGPKVVIIPLQGALKWIAAHQRPDGTWCFDHTKGACNGRCSRPGSADAAINGATALAILPFLGAAQTHQQGKYQKTVDYGLAALIKSLGANGKQGSWWESDGRMYSHGLAAIAICEAYGMTNDKRLLPAAQSAIRYIEYAQDPIGGGWRYEPRQKGDTSVVGWQLMALKSAHMAYLEVDMNVIKKSDHFLDSVQTDSGAMYGYTSPGRGDATTAIGLLCRMYNGWQRDNPALKRGVEYLDRKGPSPNNMYYNYYATQVMFLYGGEPWKRWDARMRPMLLDSQAGEDAGHEAGSWYFNGGHGGSKGGRLYSTCMAAMTLEVYYRIMPLYQDRGDDFQL